MRVTTREPRLRMQPQGLPRFFHVRYWHCDGASGRSAQCLGAGRLASAKRLRSLSGSIRPTLGLTTGGLALLSAEWPAERFEREADADSQFMPRPSTTLWRRRSRVVRERPSRRVPPCPPCPSCPPLPRFRSYRPETSAQRYGISLRPRRSSARTGDLTHAPTNPSDAPPAVASPTLREIYPATAPPATGSLVRPPFDVAAFPNHRVAHCEWSPPASDATHTTDSRGGQLVASRQVTVW